MLNSVTKITGANCLPNMLTLDKKNAEELRNLRIVQVQWYFSYTLDFTLNDGQTLKTGTTRDFYNGHTFDRNKKITKVEVVISNDKRGVLQINFYSGEELLVKLGWPGEWYKANGGRVEICEITEEEQLIGCQLEHGLTSRIATICACTQSLGN